MTPSCWVDNNTWVRQEMGLGGVWHGLDCTYLCFLHARVGMSLYKSFCVEFSLGRACIRCKCWRVRGNGEQAEGCGS